jgi:hypothetical protein
VRTTRVTVAVLLLLATSLLGLSPHPARAASCLTWVDLTTYFVPTYPGWQTAKLTETQTIPSVGTTFDRKYLYDANKLALVKFNNPHSVETYTWDTHWIYLTAENGINGSPQSRVYPVGNNFLGLSWMPRYGCTRAHPIGAVSDFNQFTPCYTSQVNYNNCNSCPCQYDHADPTHCSLNPSYLLFTNYNFGGSIGTIPTVIKQDYYDDNSGYEYYYYGLGYGFLRFEAYNARGQLVVAGGETAETPNDPIPDQACFHP